MANMFYECFKLTSLDLSKFDTHNVTNTDLMFAECKTLNTIYVSDKFNLSNVTSSSTMFRTNNLLIGQNNTSFDSSKTDITYAVVDGYSYDTTQNKWIPDSNSHGYFTLKV